MPNHWHFVVWPERDGDLPAFMQQVTNTHVKRWKEHRHEVGYGHLDQGRYECFPVETEDYFYQVVPYVERNALCANLVERAGTVALVELRRVEREDPAFPILSTWPLPRPTDWLQILLRWQFTHRCSRRRAPRAEVETRESTDRLAGRHSPEESSHGSAILRPGPCWSLDVRFVSPSPAHRVISPCPATIGIGGGLAKRTSR